MAQASLLYFSLWVDFSFFPHSYWGTLYLAWVILLKRSMEGFKTSRAHSRMQRMKWLRDPEPGQAKSMASTENKTWKLIPYQKPQKHIQKKQPLSGFRISSENDGFQTLAKLEMS